MNNQVDDEFIGGFTKGEIEVINRMFSDIKSDSEDSIDGAGEDEDSSSCNFVKSISEGGEELFLNKKDALNYLLSLLQ